MPTNSAIKSAADLIVADQELFIGGTLTEYADTGLKALAAEGGSNGGGSTSSQTVRELIPGLTDGLVAAWLLNSQLGFAIDVSGNENHLTTVGVPAKAPTGQFANSGSGVSFAQAESKLQVPLGTAFDPSQTFMIVGWVQERRNPFSVWDSVNGDLRSWRIESPATGRVQFSADGVSGGDAFSPSPFTATPSTPNSRGYLFLAFWYDAATGTLGIRSNNQVYTQTGFTLFNPVTTLLTLGGRSPTPDSQDYNLNLDQVLYFSEIKSQAFLNSLYNSGNGVDLSEGLIDFVSSTLPAGAATATNQQPWAKFNSSPANLTAPGVTAFLDTSTINGDVHWVVRADVGTVNTSATFQVRGTVGGISTVISAPETIFANGFVTFVGQSPIDGLALEFVSETGGTTAVVSNIRLRARGRV